MQFTNLSYTTTKQYKDSLKAMMKRDAANLEEIISKPVVLLTFAPSFSLEDFVTDEGVSARN